MLDAVNLPVGRTLKSNMKIYISVNKHKQYKIINKSFHVILTRPVLTIIRLLTVLSSIVSGSMVYRMRSTQSDRARATGGC